MPVKKEVEKEVEKKVEKKEPKEENPNVINKSGNVKITEA